MHKEMIVMKRFLLTLILVVTGSQVGAAPLELLQPYNFMLEHDGNIGRSKWQFTAMTEIGYNTQGYDVDGKQVDSLSIYESRQNLLGLFQGYEADSQFAQRVNALAGGPGGGVNNDENGWFTPIGNLSASQIALGGSYQLMRSLYVKVHIPFYKVSLHDVQWSYSGNNATFADAAIEEKLVANFRDDAKNLFDLDIDGWDYKHIGDVTCMLDFCRDFPQGRQWLRNVRAHLRFGLTLPTGVKDNPNKLMFIPSGNDGSVSIPFGGGLDINLMRYCQLGFRGQFQYFWGSQSSRRVKTFDRQTTLLMPEVVDSFKNFGFEQRFNLYAQAFNVFAGCSLKVAYEYMKQSESTLSVAKTGLDYELMNSSNNLDEKTAHHVLLSLIHDSGFTERHGRLHPQFTAFVKIPFYGSYINTATSFGFQLSFDW